MMQIVMVDLAIITFSETFRESKVNFFSSINTSWQTRNKFLGADLLHFLKYSVE